MSKKKKRKFKLIITTAIILIIALIALVCIDFYLKVTTPYAGYKNNVTISIPKGASISWVARILAREKIIPGYYYFRIYYRMFYHDTDIKSGEYLFDTPMTMKEIIAKMHEGKIVLHKLTIREGLSIFEVAGLVSSHPSLHIRYSEFIDQCRSTRLINDLDPKATDLEGYLFPDTYLLRPDVTAKEIVELMVERFKENFSGIMLSRARELKLTIRQILTLASLIEKETASREERFLISSVFHNRIRKGMLLDCDPTIVYALKRDNLYRGKLGWDELKYNSPYNTRLFRGLPPGPICSPGLASIEAALYPENTSYFYFVAKNPQSHYFSETLEEHNRAVHKFIINHKKE